MYNGKIQYNFESKDNIIVFTFEGEFTNQNAALIFDQVKEDILKIGKYNTVLNFGKIETINSRAAGGMADVFETVEQYGGTVYVTNLNDFVDDALDLLGMFLFINKAPTEEIAIGKLSR